MDKDQLIVESAKILLPFIASLDPLWRDEIDCMKQERGFDDLQCLGALVGYTLEQQAHMWIPRHPFFSDTHMAAGTKRECPECHKEWIVAYPGQPVCSNRCAASYHAVKNYAKEVANAPVQEVLVSKGRKVKVETLTTPTGAFD
jgi:hypothetical protein